MELCFSLNTIRTKISSNSQNHHCQLWFVKKFLDLSPSTTYPVFVLFRSSSLSYVTNPIHLFICQLLGLLLHWTNQRNSHTKTLNICYSSFLLPFTIQIFLLCLIEVHKSNFVEKKSHCTVYGSQRQCCLVLIP